jgi:putative phosphoribosyl transferase
VAPIDVLRELQDEADEIVYLEAHEDFGAIGFYYADFRQIADDEVTAILAELAEAARRRETVAAV